jgi:hypothetical protein
VSGSIVRRCHKPDYTVTDGRMVDEMKNRKGFGRKRSWPYQDIIPAFPYGD